MHPTSTIHRHLAAHIGNEDVEELAVEGDDIDLPWGFLRNVHLSSGYVVLGFVLAKWSLIFGIITFFSRWRKQKSSELDDTTKMPECDQEKMPLLGDKESLSINIL